MILIKKYGRAPLAAVVSMLVFAFFCGCEKEAPKATLPVVITDRTMDADYTNALVNVCAERTKLATRRDAVAAQLERLVARARAALPPGATDEQVKAELDGHPEKYLAWKKLSAQNLALLDKVQRNTEKARDTVRARILKESADRRAVAEGRAKAAPSR